MISLSFSASLHLYFDILRLKMNFTNNIIFFFLDTILIVNYFGHYIL